MQCFDALSYLQLVEGLPYQSPLWQCPICNKPAALANLAVDEYVQDILKNTPTSVDQVNVEADGTWSQTNKKDASPPHFSTSGDDFDDDIIEIQDSRVATLKTGSVASNTPTSIAPVNTPPGSSREPSSSVGPPKQSNGKRPASAVIDLTLSDDEEPISRPTKRPHYGTTNSGTSNGTTSNGIPHRAGHFT